MGDVLKNPNSNRQAGGAGPMAIALPFVIAALGISSAAAAVKKVPYPEVKVEIVEAYRPDGAFEAMIARFSAAVAKKDEQALFAQVGPNFVWTLEGALTDEFDLGRETLHNFKVVFGFPLVGQGRGRRRGGWTVLECACCIYSGQDSQGDGTPGT